MNGRQSGTALNDESLVRFFRMMGYDPGELHTEGATRPVVDVRDIYRRLPDQQPDVVAHAASALAALERSQFAAPGAVEDAAYLADLAALASKDASWCRRIPDDLVLLSQKQHFLDWCLFTLATNLQEVELCQRIPVRPYPIANAAKLPPAHVREINLQMSLRAQCERELHPASAPSRRYAPELPPDDERTRRLIALLDYPLPRASTLPAQRLAAAYQLFLGVLTGADASLHGPALKRLIERLKALPDMAWDGSPAK